MQCQRVGETKTEYSQRLLPRDIQTTLNVNTQAVSADKREANSKVVRMVLLNTGQKQLWPARAMFEWFVTMESG